MAEDIAHVSGEDRILLSGVEASLAALSTEELSRLRRILSMSVRIAPLQIEASEALAALRENVGRDGNEAVERLASQMAGYLDRAVHRIENGLKTWMGVRVSLRLRELSAECSAGGGER
ncbi:MAG: hypothetical protein JXQ29_01000 [Planctomycetes bacterium]|nr:hypothetical protein [Planctomycetota bacterium]